MLTSALLSFIMSEHAVAAMMFPLLIIITKRLKVSTSSGSYGKILFLAMAWGCVIGGIATMLGGARVPLAVGLLEQAGNGTITFAQWTIAMFPIVLILFTFGYFLLTRFFSIDIGTVAEAGHAIEEQIRSCGRPLLEERFLGPPDLGRNRLLDLFRSAAWDVDDRNPRRDPSVHVPCGGVA